MSINYFGEIIGYATTEDSFICPTCYIEMQVDDYLLLNAYFPVLSNPNILFAICDRCGDDLSDKNKDALSGEE